MAIVNTGNDLVAPILQSGWTVVSDGFGLHTSVSVYKADTTSALTAFLVKGTAHPDPSFNEGVRTNPNTSAANGLTSEPITSHPAFFNNPAGSGYAGDIAGPGPYTQSSTGPIVMSKTTPSRPEKSYMGINGACFESVNGGRFIGFVDPTFPSLYGKTNYLATTTSYSGVMYSTTLADVQALLALLNTATATTSWGVFALLPSWAPIGTVAAVGHKNLLSQVNVEQFGALYKINYEIRYSKAGWDAFVYVNI